MRWWWRRRTSDDDDAHHVVVDLSIHGETDTERAERAEARAQIEMLKNRVAAIEARNRGHDA